MELKNEYAKVCKNPNCKKKNFNATKISQDFCSPQCWDNYRYHFIPGVKEKVLANSKKNYEANKDNASYKKRKKENLKKWLLDPDNKKKFLKMCRDNIKKKRQERLKKGLCYSCGKKLTTPGFINCSDCREKNRRWKSKR